MPISEKPVIINGDSDRLSISPQQPQNFLKKRFKVFLIVILVGASFFAGSFYGRFSVSKSQTSGGLDTLLALNHDQNQPKDINFNLFWEAWNLLNQKYVDPSKLDKTKMIYGAISGMIKAVGDPFSSFMDPQESQQFSEDLQGSFEGIGTEVGMKNGILTVISPIDGAPAEKAGLKAGDKILKIDDALTTDMTVDAAVAKIRGPKGTSVTLTILHDNENTPKEIKIVRDTINVKSVKVDFKDNGIAVIRISKFGDDTDSGINQAATQILTARSKGIIVDLRNDPGGYLETAVNTASKFIPKDETIVSEEDRGGSKKEYKARGGDILGGLPVVVLVNGGSASASEILSGALRDDLGSVLVGDKTFGKGSVQELEKMTGGSQLRVTVARWLTPKGEYIMEKGLNPDIQVDLTDDDYSNNRDPQMDKAVEILKSKMN